MKSLLLFAISFLCFSPLCLAQTVWPGDVNNNGIVNEIDLLYLGYAFGEVGPARAMANSDWDGQAISTLWEGTFPEGLNFAYADCDGNGIVDELDADIIEKYLGETYIDGAFDEILASNSESIPTFYLSNTEGLAVAPGETIKLTVGLNNVGPEQVNHILGFAFTLSVDTSFFEMAETEYAEELSTWIKVQGPATNRIFLNEEGGKLTIAYTKTDKIGVNGSGPIGETSFVIEDDIINFLAPTDSVKISIDSITLVTDDLERIVIGGTSIDLDILGRTTSTYNPILDKIKCYPNPTNGWLLLRSKEVFIERVELVNTLGQVVYHKQLNNTTFQSLDLQHIPEGMYWLRMITELGTKSTPIQRL